ncbi:MAG: hypothetical protein LBO07_06060 [Coriobacteriales bacterium]|jgi:hypothetical protein|nr:hypothetical protein [Coriobacteriales bacterium]
MTERIWSDEQLAEMSRRTIEKAFDAIEAGEAARARELVQLMYDQFVKLHDGYMTWIGGLLTFLYREGGVEKVEAAERFAHDVEARLVFFPPERTDFQFMVERMASELQGHVLQHMTLEEDDEKLVLKVSPCGSGGRLIQMGAYRPEVGLARIAEPADITFHTADYPIYCVHCPLFNMNALDAFGDFTFINEPPQEDGSYCRFIFYKDKARIPEEYYRRLGRLKPQETGKGV